MLELDPAFRQRRLADLHDADVSGLWRVLESLRTMKTVKSGASVVAISMFLPRASSRVANVRSLISFFSVAQKPSFGALS